MNIYKSSNFASSRNHKSSNDLELVALVKLGNRKAANHLIQSKQAFVESVCRNYKNQGMLFEDLVAEGNLGLVRAAHRFDENMNCQFVSYAVWWVRQAVLSALADQSRFLSIPPSRVQVICKIFKANRKLEQTLGRQPSDIETSDETGYSLRKVINSQCLVAAPISFSNPDPNESVSNLPDTLEDSHCISSDHSTKQFLLKKRIQEVLSLLDEKKAMVLKLYFGIGAEFSLSMVEIGYRLELSSERVRQILSASIKLLQSPRYLNHILVAVAAQRT